MSADGYDQMQVCVNGHQITTMARQSPQFRKPFCSDCGGRTIDACEKCNFPIPGFYHISGVLRVGQKVRVPKYCSKCGAAFPWQEAAIENLKELALEAGLAAQEVEEIEAALADVVVETPKTPSASLKLKRLLGKLGKPLYDVAIHVVTDIASETAKKTMGLS